MIVAGLYQGVVGPGSFSSLSRSLPPRAQRRGPREPWSVTSKEARVGSLTRTSTTPRRPTTADRLSTTLNSGSDTLDARTPPSKDAQHEYVTKHEPSKLCRRSSLIFAANFHPNRRHAGFADHFRYQPRTSVGLHGVVRKVVESGSSEKQKIKDIFRQTVSFFKQIHRLIFTF